MRYTEPKILNTARAAMTIQSSEVSKFGTGADSNPKPFEPNTSDPPAYEADE